MRRSTALVLGASLVILAAACGSKGSSATGGATGGGKGSTASGSSGTAGSKAASATSTGSASTGSAGASATAGSTAATTGSTSSGTAMCSGPGYHVTGSIFQAAEPWNTAVDTDPVDPQSSTIIGWLANAGGWGNGNQFQIDTSITLLCADATTPMVPWTGSCSPDCDASHTTFPVPMGGAIEGETGYACNGGGDCHLLVVDLANNWLWEMYNAFSPPGPTNPFNSGGGPIIWDLTHEYTPNLRGLGCTSADAGGFPMAALLFTADEIVAGHIDHAIRFILPNARIQDGDVYVHPATHTGVAVNAGNPTRPNAPPYGVRMRLHANFDMTKLANPNAQVVAKALQKYGMFLSDGGNIALTAASDQFTTAKWSNTLASKDLTAIQVTDFDVVDLGALVTTGDCCDPTMGYRVP